MNIVESKILSSTLVIEEQEIDIKASTTPSVTIGIPVLNEEEHIERVVQGFLACGYPNLVEILIADGGSTDRTREIISLISQEDARVKLVDNPKKFQSFGLNKMIDVAKGDVFLRADAHCDYGDDYVKLCVQNLTERKIKNVGGAARFLAENLVQAGTAIAVLSIFGNGGAKHYNPSFEGYSDTVPMGCFWKSDLKVLSGFKESNYTNEDAEINYRIQKVLGGKIYISPDIKLWYYPRKKFTRLARQYFRYGRGRFLTASMHEGKIPFRSKAPFIFVGLMLIYLLVDDLLFGSILGSKVVLGAALMVLLFESVRKSFKERDYLNNEVWRGKKKMPSSILLSGATFVTLIIMHISHFTGYGFQLLRARLLRKEGW